jgi:hypothetical protein
MPTFMPALFPVPSAQGGGGGMFTPDLGSKDSRIRIKGFNYFNPKECF